MRVSFFAVFASACAIAALSAACVPPTNGYDPEAPDAVAVKGTLVGTVFVEDINPADDVTPSPAGVLVSVVGGPTTTAAADGSFILEEVAAGLAVVRFTFDGHEPIELNTLADRGLTTTLPKQTLALRRTPVAGTVDLLGAIDDSGALVEAVGFGVKDITGADGTFTLLVPTGTASSVDIKASRGGFASQTVTVAVAVTDDSSAVTAGPLVLAPNLGRLVMNGGATITNNAAITLNLDVVGAARVRASESQTFVEGDVVVSFVPYPADGDLAFSLSGGDGTKTVFVQVEDAAGDIILLEGDIELDTTPPVLEAVVVDDGDGITSSVSVTVSVSASGGAEMAIATDGIVDAEAFGPLAPTAIALLPAGDGVKDVCVIVRDLADNRTAPRCTAVLLDGARPSSPQTQFDDSTIVIPPDEARNFVVRLPVPSDTTVVALQVSVEPEGTLVRLTRDRLTLVPPETLASVPVDLAVPLVLPSLPFIARVVRLRFEDSAGNLSEETTLTIRIDGADPIAPEVQDATCVSGCDGRGDDVVYEVRSVRTGDLRRVNADTFVVRLKTRAREVDFNFNRFEVGQTFGTVVDPPPLSPTASIDNVLFTLGQGAPGNGLQQDPSCTPTGCLNHLFLQAVDDAKNRGPLVRIDVIEDSSPPTKPVVTPRGAVIRGDTIRLALATASTDRDGLTDEAPVRAYEIKEGVDGTFEGVPDGQPVAGPWELALVPGEVNEVCVRGVDEAGNIGIEDCVAIAEETVRFAVATSGSDRRQAIAGDHILYQRGTDVMLASVHDDIADDDAPGSTIASGVNDMRRSRLVQRGPLLDALFSGSRNTQPGNELHLVEDATGSATRRFICGDDGDIDGVNAVFGRDTSLVRASRAQLALATTVLESPCSSVGTVIVPVVTGGFCPSTAPQVDGDDVVWCENGSATGDQIGTIGVVKHIRGNGAPRIVTSTAAPQVIGSLVGGEGGISQPLVSGGLILWTEGTRPTVRVLVSTDVVQNAIDTGVEVAKLVDADGGRALVQVLTDDGLGNDMAILDVASYVGVTPARLPLVRLTDDLAPQDDGALSGFRASWADLSSFTEDIAVADFSTERPIAASPDFDISPETSSSTAAWFGVDEQGLRVTGLQHATGAERVVLRANEVSFQGGTVLGRNTLAVGGDVVVGAVQGVDKSWTLQTRLADQAPLTVLAAGVRTAHSTPQIDEASAAFGLDERGRALVYADGVGVRFQLLPANVPTVFSPTPQTVGVVGPTAAFLDVDVNDSVSAAVLVVQQTATARNGSDIRRDGTGPIACAAFAGATLGTVVGGVVRIPSGNGTAVLEGRAPQVAIVDGTVFLALLQDNKTDVNRNVLEPRVCTLTCSATPTCTQPLTIGPPGDTGPELSDDGLLVTIDDGEVVVTDAATRRFVGLTGPIDGAAPRQTARIGGRRVVWADARLGSFDVWTSFVP